MTQLTGGPPNDLRQEFSLFLLFCRRFFGNFLVTFRKSISFAFCSSGQVSQPCVQPICDSSTRVSQPSILLRDIHLGSAAQIQGLALNKGNRKWELVGNRNNDRIPRRITRRIGCGRTRPGTSHRHARHVDSRITHVLDEGRKAGRVDIAIAESSTRCTANTRVTCSLSRRLRDKVVYVQGPSEPDDAEQDRGENHKRKGKLNKILPLFVPDSSRSGQSSAN